MTSSEGKKMLMQVRLAQQLMRMKSVRPDFVIITHEVEQKLRDQMEKAQGLQGPPNQHLGSAPMSLYGIPFESFATPEECSLRARELNSQGKMVQIYA